MTRVYDRMREQYRDVHIDPTLLASDGDTMRNALMTRCQVYEVTNVAHYLANSGQTFHHFSDFPNVGPLHPLYWMEWSLPPAYQLSSDGCPDRLGLLFWQEAPTEEGISQLSVTVWSERSKKVLPEYVWRLAFDSTGYPMLLETRDLGLVDSWCPFTPAARDRGERIKIPDGLTEEQARAMLAELETERAELTERIEQMDREIEEDNERLAEVLAKYLRHFVLFPALMAHSLLACKNVDTDSHTPPAKLSRKHERKRGVPLVTYKTLRIQPMGARSDHEGEVSFDGGKALHIVRGHFKTFTPERPLFGRVVGTYWWSSAVRGKPERGVVVKDYEIAEVTA